MNFKYISELELVLKLLFVYALQNASTAIIIRIIPADFFIAFKNGSWHLSIIAMKFKQTMK